jgi:hypothetical protein
MCRAKNNIKSISSFYIIDCHVFFFSGFSYVARAFSVVKKISEKFGAMEEGGCPLSRFSSL